MDQLFPDRTLGRLLILRSLFWTLLVGFFVLLGVLYNRDENIHIAVGRARDSYNKDVSYRTWATQRGGVYVPLDEKTPANPYLNHIPDRDIVGSNGKTYTLVNPAYMTRMVHEVGREYGLQGHITSLNPLRPENAPDEWERKALKVFESGAREYWEAEASKGGPYLRYMGAFLVQEGCLRCHGHQGYKVGDVRGGISVRVPLRDAPLPGRHSHEWVTLVGLGSLWVVGLLGIFLGGRWELRQAADRRAALRDLAESRQIYQSLVDALPMSLYRLDVEGGLTFANTAMLRELGSPLEACLGKTAFDFFPASYAEKYRADDLRVMAGETLHQVEDHPDPNGGPNRKVKVVKVALKDAQGQVVGLQGVYWDVTEEVEAEARLQESNGRFQTFIESCPLPIGVHQAEHFVYANPAYLKLLGAPSPSSLLGHHVLEFVDPEFVPKAAGILRAPIDPQGMGLHEGRFRRLDGTTFDVEYRRFPITLNGEPAVLAFIEELTERKRRELEHRELEEHLQQAQKMESLGSLAGGVAHDMNNILGAILGLASVQGELQPEGSPARKAFDTITKACTRGGNLVRRLLDFARRDLAEERELDMNALIREEAQLLEHTTLSKVHLVLQLAPDLRLILGDAGALTHALMNLCVNAVDAMAEGGTLTLRTRNIEGPQVEIEVEDTGQGMSPEVIKKALDPFFTTKAQGKGTGLGLSMVYRTVTSHHGTLTLHSEPGRGTRVVMRFPACSPSAESALGEAPGAATADARVMEVLVIDDDELIRTSMAAMLEALGHRATFAESGEAGLALVAGGLAPDLVILDLNMPGLGGAGTLPRLRTLRPGVPVLLATGRADQTALDLLQAHAGVRLLLKPFRLEDLKKRLEES